MQDHSGVGSDHHKATDRQLPTPDYMPGMLGEKRLGNKFYFAVVACIEGTRWGIAGTSTRRKPSTKRGVGATLPQRLSSQPARMKLTSGTRLRSSTARVSPR